MVTVVNRFPDGSIKECDVHDMLRDLAIERAKKMDFLAVYSKEGDKESCKKARRVAIHCDVEPSGDYASPNVRSLLFFGRNVSHVDCSKYKVLRVLASNSIRGTKIKLQCFKGSPLLRYLQLVTNEIRKNEGTCNFGEWIKGMKHLETLDLRDSPHGDLSKWIWDVKTLRHVLLNYRSGDQLTQGPPISVEFPNLRTLTHIKWNDHEAWRESGFPNIPQVRELEVEIIKRGNTPSRSDPESQIHKFLNTLEHLAYLVIQFGTWCSSSLKSLVLWNFHRNCEPLVLKDGMLPGHLCELRLHGYRFGSDPMSVLEKFENLKALCIGGRDPFEAEAEGCPAWKMKCSAQRFNKLELLRLQWINQVHRNGK